MPLLLGVVGIAFGLKKAFGHAYEPADLAPALGLAGGAAAFLVGDVLFRRTLGIGEGHWRTAAAVLVAATLPLGILVAPAAQIAALVLVLGGALLVEQRRGTPTQDASSLAPA